MSRHLLHSVSEYSDKLRCAANGSEIWSITRKTLSELGVTSMGYAVIPSRREALDRGNTEASFFVHSHGNDWEDAVAQQPLLDFDLTTTRVLNGHLETHWTDDYLFDQYEVHPTAIQLARQQALVERSIGMEYGVTLCLQHQSTGGPTSGVGLCFDKEVGQNYVEFWGENRDLIRRVCELMDTHIRSQYPSFHVYLTARERDCLSYLAFGLRPQEIAFRLGLSPKALEKHFASAVRKLNARTRDQALAKALCLRLIEP